MSLQFQKQLRQVLPGDTYFYQIMMIVVEKPMQQMKSSYYNQYLPPCHLTLSSLDDLLHNRHSDLLRGWVHGELQQQHYGSKLYPTIKIDRRRAYLSEFKSWHCKDNTKFSTYIRSCDPQYIWNLGFHAELSQIFIKKSKLHYQYLRKPFHFHHLQSF